MDISRPSVSKSLPPPNFERVDHSLSGSIWKKNTGVAPDSQAGKRAFNGTEGNRLEPFKKNLRTELPSRTVPVDTCNGRLLPPQLRGRFAISYIFGGQRESCHSALSLLYLVLFFSLLFTGVML